jgi:hypothetical protein
MSHFRIQNISFLLFLPILLWAQSPNSDKLYLKNGTIIRGRILEVVPDSIVKIQTVDRSIFVYPISETTQISKDTAKENTLQMRVDSLEEDIRPAFSVFGGMAIPIRDFARDDGGSAKTGFIVGVQYLSRGKVGWLFSGGYVINKLELPSALAANGISVESGSWKSMLALTGIKLGIADPTGTRFTIAPLVGVLFGTIPEIKLTFSDGYLDIPELNIHTLANGITVAQSSASSAALAYGMAAECTLGNHIAIGVRYITSTPEYNVMDAVSGTGLSETGQSVPISETKNSTIKQKTSLILISLGYIF